MTHYPELSRIIATNAGVESYRITPAYSVDKVVEDLRQSHTPHAVTCLSGDSRVLHVGDAHYYFGSIIRHPSTRTFPVLR